PPRERPRGPTSGSTPRGSDAPLPTRSRSRAGGGARCAAATPGGAGARCPRSTAAAADARRRSQTSWSREPKRSSPSGQGRGACGALGGGLSSARNDRNRGDVMVKVITFLKRKAGMPVEEFQAYWRERHPGCRPRVPPPPPPPAEGGAEPIYDGIAEVWADDTSALRAMTQSPHHPALQEDEARFINRASMGVVITEDHVVRDGSAPPAAVKSVAFLNRKPGLSVEEFQRHWRDVHAPIASGLPGLRRYVQSHTRRSAYEGGRAPAYDGVGLAWFDSTEAIRDTAGGGEKAVVLADAAVFLSPGTAPSILTREHVIVA